MARWICAGVLVMVGAAGCGGGGSRPATHDLPEHAHRVVVAVEQARRVLGRHYDHVGRCAAATGVRPTCRVVSFKQDPSVLECTVTGRREQCRDVIPTAEELAFERRHAPRARSVLHVVSLARMSVPRRVVASGPGYTLPPFRLPAAFMRRSRLHGRGPSVYLTINRDHYEDDLVTDTGNEARVRVMERSGRLLSDTAFTPGTTASWDAITRVLELTHQREPSYFGGPRDPLSAFERLRKQGALRLAAPRRYVDRSTAWIVDGHGVPVRFTQRSGAYRLDVRFRRLERLALTPSLRRELHIGRHPHARVVRVRE